MSTKVDLKKQAVFDYIKNEIKSKGYPPSMREIMQALHFSSTNAVYGYIKKLEQDGLIRKSASKNRAIEIVEFEAYTPDIQVPVVGEVAAGRPILATENIEEYVPLPKNMFNRGEMFILKVVGESMINAGILNGDQIIVRMQNVAENGEIVVAMIDGCATVKRFYKEKTRIRLQPENDTMSPIYAEDVQIVGIVVGLLRKY